VSPNSITSAGGMDPPGRDGSSHWRFLPTGARRCEGSLGHVASVSAPGVAAGQTPDPGERRANGVPARGCSRWWT